MIDNVYIPVDMDCNMYILFDFHLGKMIANSVDIIVVAGGINLHM
jgi:hypothetical protein